MEQIRRRADTLILFSAGGNGRGDRIRTYDLLVPNQALYQAKLHPVTARWEGGVSVLSTSPTAFRCLALTAGQSLSCQTSVKRGGLRGSPSSGRAELARKLLINASCLIGVRSHIYARSTS